MTNSRARIQNLLSHESENRERYLLRTITANLRTMSVESHLTRQLNIRFIDARELCTEAKLSLGIEGYHCEDQEELLIEMAVRIFTQRPPHVRAAMAHLRYDLDTIKNPPRRSHSGCSEYSRRSSPSDCASVCASVDLILDAHRDDIFVPKVASKSRKLSLWAVRRR